MSPSVPVCGPSAARAHPCRHTPSHAAGPGTKNEPDRLQARSQSLAAGRTASRRCYHTASWIASRAFLGGVLQSLGLGRRKYYPSCSPQKLIRA